MNAVIAANDPEQNKLSPDSMLVLVRCTENNSTVQNIYVNNHKFKIGRGINCDEIILDPVISRSHCILIYKNNEWTITDLSSTHTIVNGNKLELGVPQCITVGDVIQLSSQEDYKFKVEMDIEEEPEKKKLRLSQSILDKEILEQKLFTDEQELKRQQLETQLLQKQKEQEEFKNRLEEILKNQKVSEGKTEELSGTIKFLEDKIKNGYQVECQMRQNYNDLLLTVESQKQAFEKRLNEERGKWKQALQISQQGLQNEKELLEQRLKEANDALNEKTALAQELIKSVHKPPAQVAANQEVEDIIDLTEESTPSEESNPILNKVGNIMDEQLTCQICSELFVTPVTLNCSHTYCQYCIYLWMKKNKRNCPICRGEIRSITRLLVLDNFIDQMVNDLSTQHKDRRIDLCKERKELLQQLGTPSVLKKWPTRSVRHST